MVYVYSICVLVMYSELTKPCKLLLIWLLNNVKSLEGVHDILISLLGYLNNCLHLFNDCDTAAGTLSGFQDFKIFVSSFLEVICGLKQIEN